MINVVLFEPEIPGNTGNIMRTCAGTDTKLHIIEPIGFNLHDHNIKRSGANYIENCEYEIYLGLEDFFNRNIGQFYFFTRYATQNYADINYTKDENIYLFFGKESTGLPKELLSRNKSNCLRIPTNDKIRALNLSNSVAIALFEVLRQNNYNNLLVYDAQKGKDYLD